VRMTPGEEVSLSARKAVAAEPTTLSGRGGTCVCLGLSPGYHVVEVLLAIRYAARTTYARKSVFILYPAYFSLGNVIP
jgi:hypothetical protein